MQVYGFLLSSLCLGGAHCELLLLTHTTAPNHDGWFIIMFPGHFLRKWLWAPHLWTIEFDTLVWNLALWVLVSSYVPICDFCLPVNTFSGPVLLPLTLEPWAWMEQSERVCGAVIWCMSEKDLFSFPKPSCGPLESLASPPCVYSAPGVSVWIKNC